MAETAIVKADRREPMAGAAMANAAVTIKATAPMSRLSLRAGTDALPALSAALGLDLPQRPKQTAGHGDRAALWLGPDEWLVLDLSGADLMAAVSGADGVFSAVDVSHRNTGFTVTGQGAADTLACACPQDLRLAAFPAGAASRTVFGKAEVVLWRQSETQWHLECWRSFAPYVFGLLKEGAEDAVLT
ncbi:MAG: sarcosine oxidase subunit gamma [Phyllobacteriaceae bacterium]|nr:sarcosine oxidase subunit gamma [Phyllobacteriaceae bacterium]MBA91016.1 sarcosine oxidase subunit gamma [Phyllobacteriaceae bacterium]